MEIPNNNKNARHILSPAALKYFSVSIVPHNIYFTIVRQAHRPSLAAMQNIPLSQLCGSSRGCLRFYSRNGALKRTSVKGALVTVYSYSQFLEYKFMSKFLL